MRSNTERNKSGALEAELSVPAGKTSRQSLWKRFAQQWEFQLMILPAIAFLLIFNYAPMWGILMSFQEYNLFKGFWESPWVGFDHFRMFFDSPEFWNIMRNTFAISFLKLLIGFPAPILLALMLNEVGHLFFKRVVQTITYIPHFISWVVVSGLVFSMLAVDNGAVNETLQRFNLIEQPINWMSIPEYFWGILVTVNVWKEIGFGSIVYLAAIVGIDPSLYESASIDGASKLQQIFKITIPCIAPVIVIFLILNIGNLLNAGFEDVFVLTRNLNNGILMSVAVTIDTYVYQMGIINQRFSYATAAGLFKSMLSIILLIAANGIARRLGRTSLW
ncbi:sugar ABC transporter permease [Xylanibacillus composti]|uniref:Sugar ABC transporter permease n=1 Tax=Xylanibacillus composti TaxID=1572762 RepID=A0A8J4H7V5_9BACL|nr:ABC transporter permease subunit [Xylanibacillus composti]MDT9726166.1 sugar ABC transporter permease [Xylanibacillus composti]GIQ70599.1 sugar ABC transporter permease [Xylanibacillus composti]